MKKSPYLCTRNSERDGFNIIPDGVIAQLVEQRTENPCVPGSIPGDTTAKSPKRLDEGPLGLLLSAGRSGRAAR